MRLTTSALLAASALLLAAGCKNEPKPAPEAAKPQPAQPTSPGTIQQGKPQAPAATGEWTERAAKGDELFATIQTNQGNLVVRLFAKDAPKTVQNFVGLATGEREWTDPRTGEKTKRALYDGTIFHRVIPDFMIQGGDPLGQGIGGPGYKFEDEFQSGRAFDKPCLLAMANSGANTNGSQFFITEKPTPWLNNRHTIFGEVVQGCENVAKIARVPSSGSRPANDVVIQHIAISDKAP